MSSSIGLRARSNHRPLYTINESDDDADILPRKKGKPKENIDRSGIVSFFPFCVNNFNLILLFSLHIFAKLCLHLRHYSIVSNAQWLIDS